LLLTAACSDDDEPSISETFEDSYGVVLTEQQAACLDGEFQRLADGLDTSEIAGSLFYSERTVKNIIHDVTSRLELRNRTHAVAYAIREGLI